jgi:hypothetical protein
MNDKKADKVLGERVTKPLKPFGPCCAPGNPCCTDDELLEKATGKIGDLWLVISLI